MTLNTKLILFHFLFGGIFMALMFWAMDDVEGKPFDLYKFLLRVLIFGIGMSLAQYLGNIVGKRFEKKKS